MKSKRVNVSVPAALFDAMEAARGDVSRSKFVQRALESALSRPVIPVGIDDAMAAAIKPKVALAAIRGEFACPECGAVEDLTGGRQHQPGCNWTEFPKPPATLKRGSAIELRFRCPTPGCTEGPFGSAAAVCPSHGRKAVEG